MDISIFGYKLNLEVLILIGVIYLILIGHTLCGCSRVGLMEGLKMMEGLKIMEGFDMMEGLKNKKKKSKPPPQLKKKSGLAAAAALALEAENEAKKTNDFVQKATKIMNISPNDPYRAQHEARLRGFPPAERETFLKNMIANKAQQEADEKRQVEIREAADKVRAEERARKTPENLAREKYLLDSVAVSYGKKEGFTGANINYGESSTFDLSSDHPVDTSAWSAQNMTVVQGQPLSPGVKQFLAREHQPVPLPEGEMLMFANTKFSPEFCPNTYSTSSGCAAMTGEQMNYLIMRGGNNVPYSEY